MAAALLAATGYRTRDPDSRAYITITTHLVDEPVSRWIAPQWWGAFGLQGLFRDHPAGTFVPPALLAKAGYPVAQSLFVVTLACQIVALLLMSALASRFAPPSQARALVWALQLIPIAFVFRVRANQEYPLLAGLLLAVYGIERARIGWAWIAVALGGALYALAVKGVFALLAPVLAGVWLWSRRQGGSGGAAGWVGVTLIVVLHGAGRLGLRTRLPRGDGPVVSRLLPWRPNRARGERDDAVAVPAGQGRQPAVVHGARGCGMPRRGAWSPSPPSCRPCEPG